MFTPYIQNCPTEAETFQKIRDMTSPTEENFLQFLNALYKDSRQLFSQTVINTIIRLGSKDKLSIIDLQQASILLAFPLFKHYVETQLAEERQKTLTIIQTFIRLVCKYKQKSSSHIENTIVSLLSLELTYNKILSSDGIINITVGIRQNNRVNNNCNGNSPVNLSQLKNALVEGLRDAKVETYVHTSYPSNITLNQPILQQLLSEIVYLQLSFVDMHKAQGVEVKPFLQMDT